MMRRPMRLPQVTEKEKEELYNTFMGKMRKLDAMPEVSSMSDGELSLVDDGTDNTLVIRRGNKRYKVVLTEVV